MTASGPLDNPPRQVPVQSQLSVQAAAPRKRTSWPVTFGVGAIFFGVTGVMGSLPAGFAGGLASSLIPTGAADPSTVDAIRSMTFWFTIGSLVSTVLSIMLLAIGIGLCRRRAWSLRLMWIWSVLNLGITVVATVAAYVLSRQFLANFQAHGRDLMMSMSDADVRKVSAALAIAVLVVGWSSPIFLLIWLARPTVRQETALWT